MEPTAQILKISLKGSSFERGVISGEIAGDTKINVDYAISKGKIEGDVTGGIFSTSLRGTFTIFDSKDNPVFVIESDYEAIVKVQGLTENQLDTLLAVSLATQLEPYVKASINSSLAGAGLPPVMQPPYDFGASHEHQKQVEKAKLEAEELEKSGAEKH